MLSMTPLKNAQAAKSYYEKDNYYANDSKEAAELSHWWGKGAQKLGLNGYVKVEVFENLLEGKLPSGQQLGRTNKKGNVHRPGYDLTFSAPKSVSLLAEVGGDHRIYSAHDKAVIEAMGYIEKNAIKTRAFRDGEIVFENVDNVAVAMFRHDTSREQDPSTHTHCVLLNMVEREDGKWRSISSEALFDHKMVAGLIYRACLAVELKKLGYEIEQTHADGRFEIKGVATEIIQHFSQRRQQIEERLEKEGWEGGKASAKVTLDTRKRKVEVDREKLKETWQQRCDDNNFDPHVLISAAKIKSQQQNFNLQNPNLVAYDAIQYAAAHLGEREAVFPARDLIREALAHSLGETTLDHLEKAIQTANDKGDLIAASQDHWTTLEALELESDNIRLMKEGQQRCLPMALSETVQAFTAAKEQAMGISYTKGQREAIELIFTTQDKLVGVQGRAGTGKTTFLKTVHELALNTGYNVLGLAPTKNAALELHKKTGITSLTLQKYLIDVAKEKDNGQPEKPLLIILDEASMASSRQINQLLQVLLPSNCRLSMVGDSKQLAAIESGKPFAQLQKEGMQTARMEEIIRQKSALLRDAIYNAIQGNISEAFKKIDISEEGNKTKRLQRVVDDYLGYSSEGRKSTLVLVPANEDRIAVNEGIREGLKKEGELVGTEIETKVLISRGFSRTYRTRVTNYACHDIIRFNKSYKNLGIKTGDYWKVTKIDREKNEMQLAHVTSLKKITWNPEKAGGKRDGAIEVYDVEKRSLMAGDKIRWLRNQGDDFINAQTADVIHVENNKAEVRLHNQKVVTLDLNHAENKHWDYAFAYTLHAKQGGENIRVIAHMESFRRKLSTQQAFYVAISRAEYGVRLIVDDRKACIKTIEGNTGEKSSALDALNKTDAAGNWKSLANQDQTQKAAWRKQQQQTRQTKWQASLLPNAAVSSIKHWNVEDLQQRLSERTEALAKQLLGGPNPTLTSSRELRYGKKGSLWIPIAGKHVGGWRNFESSDKGNLIQLIQHVTGSSFKESLDYAGQFLGISPETTKVISKPNQAKQRKLSKEKPFKLDAEDRKAITRAIRLEQESLPLPGTLAERYLREHRAIAGDLPNTFRYHPRVAYYHINDETKKINRKDYFPALVCVAKDQQQQTQAVQVIYLDPKTANKASVDMPKRTYGRPSLGAAVMINPGQPKVLLAEGPETGLSIAQACPGATVMVALSASNFSNLKLRSEQKEVIICMDNDGDNAMSHKAVITAAQVHQGRGHTVYLTQPDDVKQDFNDVLKRQGEAEIRRKIESATLFQAPRAEGYDQQGLDTHFISKDAREMAEWLSINGHDGIQETAAMLPQLDTPELPADKFEELSQAALQEAEMININEFDKADLMALESYLNQADLQRSDDDFDIEI